MSRRIFSGILVSLLLVGMLSLAFDIQPVRASGTIYIRSDGSIDPPTAPIYTADNVTYTLTGDITVDANGIVIQRDNIVLNGAGYTVQGTGVLLSNGIYLNGRSNVTIKNMTIKAFESGIWLNSSSNNSVSGNNITNNTECVGLLYSSNCSFSGNNITNNVFGFWLAASSSSSVSGNNITANKMHGVYLYSSSNCSVSGNNITANKMHGVSLHYSSSNSVSGNNVTNNNNGFYLHYSSSNSISGNNVTNNSYGVWVDSSSSSSVFHNNFVDNNAQVYSTIDSTNVWDKGYPSGGNYWSDYAGMDLFGGPYQNVTGSDGIGDTPYIINTDNMDHYPIMIPCFYLTCSLTIMTTTYGTTNPTFGTHTYPLDSYVQVEASPDTNYILSYWELDTVNVGAANPYTVLMDANHTLEPVFTYPPLVATINPVSVSIYLGQSVGFTSTAVGGTPPYSYQWYLNGTPVSGATLDSWTFASQPIGRYSVCLNVTDSSGNSTQSETASITVARGAKGQPTTITVPDDYPTIQEAINHASEGDTVFVRSGTYNEPVTVNKTIALIGENRETTTVNLGMIIEADKVTVSKFTVRNDTEGDNAHGIWLKGSNCLISNNIMKDCQFEGVFLDGRNGGIHGNIVVNNSFLNNGDCGILLWSCNDSLIESNMANGNSFGICSIERSCRNSIENNQVSNNGDFGIAIESYSSANFVINNTVLNNGGSRHGVTSGICLEAGCVSNRIVGNNLTGNVVGLYQNLESNDNIIYHNSFVNNERQVANYATDPCVNVWDNGYPSGGNYWSDYAGKDLFGGPYQNVTGSDGIGDTWHVLDANNTDRYPLMKPYVPLLGDINQDNTVNMQDVIIVLDAFGSYPSHPRWNPLADLNSDGRIDIGDIIIVLTNFGQH